MALHSTISEDLPHRPVWLGLVPIQGGRIVMSGAQCLRVGLRGRDDPEEETTKLIGGSLNRRYLVAWSAGTEGTLLHELFGEDRTRWLRRAIDVRRLASQADRMSDRSPEPDQVDLPLVAHRFRIPGPPPHDALDSALMTAELFLVLATKLAARGYRDVGSLLTALL